MYYWKESQNNINNYVKQCLKCTQQNRCLQHYAQLHIEVSLMPMHLIAMGLIGKFKPSPQGHQYALTVRDMLMKYTWSILMELTK